MAETTPAMALRSGDHFDVEPATGEPFEAVLDYHLGWGLVHGQIDLACHRAGDPAARFTYSIGAAVAVVTRG